MSYQHPLVELAQAALGRLVKVPRRAPVAPNPAQGHEQYAQAWGEAETQAYTAAPKPRLKLKIDSAVTAAGSPTEK